MDEPATSADRIDAPHAERLRHGQVAAFEEREELEIVRKKRVSQPQLQGSAVETKLRENHELP